MKNNSRVHPDILCPDTRFWEKGTFYMSYVKRQKMESGHLELELHGDRILNL
jgi:hypothetical protein